MQNATNSPTPVVRVLSFLPTRPFSLVAVAMVAGPPPPPPHERQKASARSRNHADKLLSFCQCAPWRPTSNPFRE